MREDVARGPYSFTTYLYDYSIALCQGYLHRELRKSEKYVRESAEALMTTLRGWGEAKIQQMKTNGLDSVSEENQAISSLSPAHHGHILTASSSTMYPKKLASVSESSTTSTNAPPNRKPPRAPMASSSSIISTNPSSLLPASDKPGGATLKGPPPKAPPKPSEFRITSGQPHLNCQGDTGLRK
jgi:hypothetical protein